METIGQLDQVSLVATLSSPLLNDLVHEVHQRNVVRLEVLVGVLDKLRVNVREISSTLGGGITNGSVRVHPTRAR